MNGQAEVLDMADDDSADAEIGAPQTNRGNSSATRVGINSAIAIALSIVAAVTGLAGWLGYRAFDAHQESQQQAVFVTAARQAALNLTTLSYTEIEADVKRIIDSSTGSFRDEFQQRSPTFIEVIKQTQSKSVGTVTAAGVESISGHQAQVLVAVSVKTSYAGAPEQEPRGWRMRISVAKEGDDPKVSDVAFIP